MSDDKHREDQQWHAAWWPLRPLPHERHNSTPPLVTADRANYSTITVDRLTVQATAVLDSNGLTRVTPEQPIAVREGDVVRVTLAGRGAEPPVMSLEIVGDAYTSPKPSRASPAG